MTVNRLGDNRVLVTLRDSEMNDYLLDFQKMSLSDSHSRRVLLRIMQMALRRSGISVGERRVDIEAMQCGGDCYLLMTVVQKPSRHTYRLKRGSFCACYAADSAEILLQTIEKLRQARYLSAKSAVYTLNGRYYLIFDSILPDAYRRVLSEYTRKTGGAITAARVREYGTPVCEQHAVSAIGKWL